jgi:hypothetical protein
MQKSVKCQRNTKKRARCGSTKRDQKDGGPGRSRTADQQFRKLLLYPSELRGREVIVTDCRERARRQERDFEQQFIGVRLSSNAVVFRAARCRLLLRWPSVGWDA